jgi:hypothetical protein
MGARRKHSAQTLFSKYHFYDTLLGVNGLAELAIS